MATTNIAALQQAPSRPVAEMRPKERIAHLLDQKKHELAKMLPKTLSIDRLLKVAQIAATTTPQLANCDVPSLVGAIGQCAQMGLEPNTVLGHAYLVPFRTKRKDGNGVERWVDSVQVIVGYKGMIDLARRSGQIVSIAAHEVCEADHFELVYGLDEKLNHTPAMGERGQVVGFYAVAKLQGGGHAFEFMSVHQVREIARATQSKGNYGPWKDHFTEMGRKTVIRRLAKYLPLSIEFQTAVALDGMAEAGKDQGNTIDGSFNFVPDDAPAQAGVDGETGEIVRAGAIAGQEPPAFDIDAFAARIAACVDLETLQVLSDEAEELPDGPDRDRAMQALIQRDRQLASAPAPTPAPTPTQSPAASPAARVARRGAGSAGQTVIE